MAIGLYDGNAFHISGYDTIERSQALSFFLNGHINDALLLHDTNGTHCGIITYKSLLNSCTMQQAVVKDTLVLEDGQGEAFWEKAQQLIPSSNDSMVPVFNHAMELLYFAKYNFQLYVPLCRLEVLQLYVDRNFWIKFNDHQRHIHITGMSDVSFLLRKWLCSVGASVSVEGKAWSLLGIDEAPCTVPNAILVDETCQWLKSIYLEYIRLLEETMWDDVSKLKKSLLKPYTKIPGTNRILFHLTALSFFAESISPLIFYYLKQGKDCVAVFPPLQDMIAVGADNVRKIVNLIDKIKNLGGACYSREILPEVLEESYDICFFCSEYSGSLPPLQATYSVSLQTTATYTHMYYIKGRFEEVFSTNALQKTDYLIASEFITEWISQKASQWKSKILSFGYPKIDTLYNSLKKTVIPTEWIEKTQNKKIILYASDEISEAIWNYLSNNQDLVLIWRPHPLAREIFSMKKNAEEKSKWPNVIIDWELSYYASFQLSDAMISHGCTSVTSNYLFLNKPVCIFDDKAPSEQLVMDYRQEAWYKSAYIALQDKDIIQFIEMVSQEKDWKKEELTPYRQVMVKHFDGKVCERIYNYFEHIL